MFLVYTDCVKKRYTYKLRPGKTAQSYLVRVGGINRWLWNICVARFNEREDTNQKTLNTLLTTLRHNIDWLGEHPVVPQQQLIRDFGATRTAFFSSKRGRPKFKTRRGTLPSMNYTRRGFSLKDDGKTLKLAGKITIPVVLSRPLPSEPSSVRVYQDSCGDWWASFVVDVEPQIRPRIKDGTIGIDWGVQKPATTTNPDLDLGYTPRVKDNARQLAKYQKRMAKHKADRDWENYRKSKKKAAKLHRRVKNQRKEQARRWAQDVAKNNANIAVEDFKSKFLHANKTLAKKATDNAVGLVKQELIIAAETYGCTVVFVDPHYTTMDCSNCGTRAKAKLELNVRTYTCDRCGVSLDRDLNAARNMVKRAGFNPSDNDSGNSVLSFDSQFV